MFEFCRAITSKRQPQAAKHKLDQLARYGKRAQQAFSCFCWRWVVSRSVFWGINGKLMGSAFCGPEDVGLRK